jgi:hypothetical protein
MRYLSVGRYAPSCVHLLLCHLAIDDIGRLFLASKPQDRGVQGDALVVIAAGGTLNGAYGRNSGINSKKAGLRAVNQLVKVIIIRGREEHLAQG